MIQLELNTAQVLIIFVGFVHDFTAEVALELRITIIKGDQPRNSNLLIILFDLSLLYDFRPSAVNMLCLNMKTFLIFIDYYF